MVQYRWAGVVVRAWSGLTVVVLVRVCFTLVSVHLSLFSCLQNGTLGNSSLSLSSSCSLLTWVSFSVIFFEFFPLPVLDFLGGGSPDLIHPQAVICPPCVWIFSGVNQQSCHIANLPVDVPSLLI